MDNNKYILYFDYNSKKMVKNNLADLSQQGATIVNSLQEITEEVLGITHTCVILEGVMHIPNIAQQLKLYKNLLNLEYVYLGNDSAWFGKVSELARIYECDITLLDSKIINAALYDDNALRTDVVADKHFNEALDDARRMLKNSDLYTSEVLHMAENIILMYDTMNDYKKQINDIEQENSVLAKKCALFEKENKKYLQGYTSILKDSRELNNTLKKYEAIITKDVYDKVILSNYSKKPKIVYLKEFEAIDNFDVFLSVLSDIVKLQCKMSVKTIVLIDSKTSMRISMFPEYYKVIYNSFTNSDVITNDFIVKAGNYIDMFDIILTNRNNLDLLVVVDLKSVQDIVFSGNMVQLAICKSKQYFKAFNLFESMTINNDPESEMYWGEFKELNEIEDDDDRFLFLSSRPVFQKIYTLITNFTANL